MKSNDLKTIFWLIGLGASLVIYAHSTFTTKEVAQIVQEDVKEIRSDVKYIRNYLLEGK